MTQNEMTELYVAWTQGGSDEIYRDRKECFEWLKSGKEDGEPILADVTDEALRRTANALVEMYINEQQENEE